MDRLKGKVAIIKEGRSGATDGSRDREIWQGRHSCE